MEALILALVVVTAISVFVSYKFGTKYKNKWWLVAMPSALIASTSLIFGLYMFNKPPDCINQIYNNWCGANEFLIAGAGFFVAIASIVIGILSLIAAFVGRRNLSH